jgi:hypothetical protein
MSKFTLHMTIVDASQRSRPRLFQPQFLLEGFQRLAGSLNGLGRSVFRLLSCCRAVLQEGGTSILSRPCAFFRHCCCCCLSTKPFHHLSNCLFPPTSPPPGQKRRLRTCLHCPEHPIYSPPLPKLPILRPRSPTHLSTRANTCLELVACSRASACKHPVPLFH